MTACPTQNQLNSFLSEALDPAASAVLVAHVEECTSCQDLLAHLSAGDAPSSLSFLQPTSMQSNTPPPAFLDRVKKELSDPKEAPEVQAEPRSGRSAPLPTVPGYELIAEIGRGGMGVVFKARHLGLNRFVALKMLLAARFAAPHSRERFQREAQAIGRLHHANIVQVYDFGATEAGPFLSLELIEGDGLDRRLKGGRWQPGDAAAFVERLAWAVQYAHERGVIHRDLKPANVLVEADPARQGNAALLPKISDFGLAKCIDADQAQTPDGAILGTPSYLAPEQVERSPQAVGPAADVYGLGAILYELLTGHPPFRGDNVLATLMKVQHEDPTPPARFGVDLPRDLETICMKCLRKRPADRYASAAELAEDLHRFLVGEPIKARPIGALGHAWKWTRRHPAIAGLLVLVGTLLLIGGAVTTTLWLSESRARNAADLRRQEMEVALAQKLILLAHHEYSLRKTDEAKAHLAAVPEMHRNAEWRSLKRHVDAERVRIANKHQVMQWCFNANARHLAAVLFIDNRTQVRLWDSATGKTAIQFHPETDALGVYFEPDGERVGVVSVGAWSDKANMHLIVNRYHLDGRPADRRTLPASGEYRWAPVVFPDSRTVATSTFQDLVQWNLDSGKQSRYGGRANVLTLFPDRQGKEIAGCFYPPVPGKPNSPQWECEIIDMERQQKKREFPGAAGGRAVLFTPDLSAYLCFEPKYASEESQAVFVDAQTGKTRWRREATNQVNASHISANGTRLCFGGHDRIIQVLDVATGDEFLTLRGHQRHVQKVVLSADGNWLASTDASNEIRIWWLGESEAKSDGTQPGASR